jgi:hypothetical protein
MATILPLTTGKPKKENGQPTIITITPRGPRAPGAAPVGPRNPIAWRATGRALRH